MSMFNKLKAMRARMGQQPGEPAAPQRAADALVNARSMWDMVTEVDLDDFDLKSDLDAAPRPLVRTPAQPSPPSRTEAPPPRPEPRAVVAEPVTPLAKPVVKPAAEIEPTPEPIVERAAPKPIAPKPAVTAEPLIATPAARVIPPAPEPVSSAAPEPMSTPAPEPRPVIEAPAKVAPEPPMPAIPPRVAAESLPPAQTTEVSEDLTEFFKFEPEMPSWREPQPETRLEKGPAPQPVAPSKPASRTAAFLEEIAPPAEREVAEKPVAEKPKRGGRVKTRLIGFEKSSGEMVEVADPENRVIPPELAPKFPVGWLVVVAGPGRGATYLLGAGVAQIGRDEGQSVQLDFGDETISRANHASIAFDDEARAFFIGHGGKSNIVRLNGKPVLSTEQMKDGDMIKIGETMLRLVALCGGGFSWADSEETIKTNG